MVDIPEAWLPVVNALLGAPVAWRTPAQLAAALADDVEETTNVLCLLDLEGWIDVWDCEPGPCVTLSALAAERLNVHLVEVGPEEVPRWARIGDPIPPPPKARHVCVSERAAALDIMPDPAPTPDLAAEQAEQADREATADPSGTESGRRATRELPRPTLLVGLGLTPWPGPSASRATRCLACRGERLDPSEYCLCCDRWGLEHLLAAGTAARPAQPKPRRVPTPEEQARWERLQYERERARRKEKRQKRHQATLEATAARRRPTPPRDAAPPNLRGFTDPPVAGPSPRRAQGDGSKPAARKAAR